MLLTRFMHLRAHALLALLTRSCAAHAAAGVAGAAVAARAFSLDSYR